MKLLTMHYEISLQHPSLGVLLPHVTLSLISSFMFWQLLRLLV